MSFGRSCVRHNKLLRTSQRDDRLRLSVKRSAVSENVSEMFLLYAQQTGCVGEEGAVRRDGGAAVHPLVGREAVQECGALGVGDGQRRGERVRVVAERQQDTGVAVMEQIRLKRCPGWRGRPLRSPPPAPHPIDPTPAGFHLDGAHLIGQMVGADFPAHRHHASGSASAPAFWFPST